MGKAGHWNRNLVSVIFRPITWSSSVKFQVKERTLKQLDRLPHCPALTRSVLVLVVDVVASVAKDPVDGGDGGDGGRVTDPPGQQLLPDLPGEHPGVVRLDPDDSLHHAGCRHLLT